MKRVLLLSFMLTCCLHGELELIKTYQTGALYRLDKLNVVRLHGTYHEMGRQYGTLMKEAIARSFEKLVIKGLLETKEVSTKQLAQHALHLLDSYPAQLIQLLQGMAETTGKKIEQLALLDHYLELLVLYKHHRAGCSTMIAYGPCSKDNKTILGRNFDFPFFLRDMHDELTIICFNPTDGSNTVATFGFAGQLSSYIFGCNPFFHCGINDSSISAGRQIVSERMPLNTQMLQMLFNMRSITSVERVMASIRSPYAFILFAAGHKDGAMFELPTFGFKRRPLLKEGLYLSTNHLTHPDWGLYLPHDVSDPGLTRRRERNLIKLIESYNSQLDPDALRAILDTRLTKDDLDSGATQYERVKNVMLTLYQFVSLPEEGKVWIKVPLYMDWCCLDLKKVLLTL